MWVSFSKSLHGSFQLMFFYSDELCHLHLFVFLLTPVFCLVSGQISAAVLTCEIPTLTLLNETSGVAVWKAREEDKVCLYSVWFSLLVKCQHACFSGVRKLILTVRCYTIQRNWSKEWANVWNRFPRKLVSTPVFWHNTKGKCWLLLTVQLWVLAERALVTFPSGGEAALHVPVIHLRMSTNTWKIGSSSTEPRMCMASQKCIMHQAVAV